MFLTAQISVLSKTGGITTYLDFFKSSFGKNDEVVLIVHCEVLVPASLSLLYFFVIVLKIDFIYLQSRFAGRGKKKRERENMREVLYLLAYSPNGC